MTDDKTLRRSPVERLSHALSELIDAAERRQHSDLVVGVRQVALADLPQLAAARKALNELVDDLPGRFNRARELLLLDYEPYSTEESCVATGFDAAVDLIEGLLRGNENRD